MLAPLVSNSRGEACTPTPRRGACPPPPRGGGCPQQPRREGCPQQTGVGGCPQQTRGGGCHQQTVVRGCPQQTRREGYPPPPRGDCSPAPRIKSRRSRSDNSSRRRKNSWCTFFANRANPSSGEQNFTGETSSFERERDPSGERESNPSSGRERDYSYGREKELSPRERNRSHSVGKPAFTGCPSLDRIQVEFNCKPKKARKTRARDGRMTKCRSCTKCGKNLATDSLKGVNRGPVSQ